MGHFATGVTHRHRARRATAPVGFTAQSFLSLSIDPPLVAVSPALDVIVVAAHRGGRRVVHQHPRRRPRGAVPRLRDPERGQVRRRRMARCAVHRRADYRRIARLDRRPHRSDLSRRRPRDRGDRRARTRRGDKRGRRRVTDRCCFTAPASVPSPSRWRRRRASFSAWRFSSPQCRSCPCAAWARDASDALRLPRVFTEPTPFVELLIGAGLLGGLRLMPEAALGVLLIYTGVLLVQISRADAPPCACFGRAAKPITWRTIARNGGLLLVAIVSVAA